MAIFFKSSPSQVFHSQSLHSLRRVLIIACSAELIGRGCLSARVLPHPHSTQYVGASRSRPAPARDQNPCLEQLSVGDVLRAIPATETAILPRQLRRRHAARSSGPMSLEPLVVRNRRFATFAVRPNASGSFVFPGMSNPPSPSSSSRRRSCNQIAFVRNTASVSTCASLVIPAKAGIHSSASD
jgi:hypothetical protein